jgi:hypothetical protein
VTQPPTTLLLLLLLLLLLPQDFASAFSRLLELGCKNLAPTPV